MGNTSPAGRPGWQRNSFFQFFASVKLAVVLLAVLIIASIVGTLYESSFDAKVARAYVYGAPWFNIWLILLATNLTVSALSRWPWRRHHVAFLITHLGIITLLAGSLIGRVWGIEGTITLFKGDPPSNRLLLDQHQLRVRDTDNITKGYPAEFLKRKPTPEDPRDLGTLASGARLSLVDYAEEIEGRLQPRPAREGTGVPAVHVRVATAMMGQKLESWLLADEGQNARFDMGLARIELKRGRAAGEDGPQEAKAAPPATGETEIEESIFAFQKAPDQQVGRVARGGSTGAKVTLTEPTGGNKGSLTVALSGKSWTFDVAANLGESHGDHLHTKDLPLEGSPFVLRIENYWPDFRIVEGKPSSATAQPNNPAVLVSLRGRGVPVPSEKADDPHAAAAGESTGANSLVLFVADDGTLSYELSSRAGGKKTGALERNQSLATGWADWTLTVDEMMPRAEHWMEFRPLPAGQPPRAERLPDGVKIRVEQEGKTLEQWVPAGWQIMVATEPQPIQVSYGWRSLQLPIGLELLGFEVTRNEGSDSPAGFKSTVRVTALDGRTAVGQCWMNNPFSFPDDWWRPFTGHTYKMSQASWNPDNLGQSTVQILRDPGWSLKWIGSLLICVGVFLLFYVKKFRRQSAGSPVTRPARVENRPAPEPATVGSR